MFSKDALLFALIIMCVILFITWAVVYSEKDDLEEENKELKVKLEDAIHNNERYLTLSTHQQMQDRSLKIWELEKDSILCLGIMILLKIQKPIEML